MIRSYHSPERIKKICRQLILQKVYSEYGTMISWYNHPDRIKNIFVHFNDDGTISGAFVILHKRDIFEGYNCGTFVKPDFRRAGIGRKLIERAKQLNLDIYPWKGNYTARSFYQKVI